MRDAPSEDGRARVLLVDVNRIEIAADRAEHRDIRLRHRLGEFSRLADFHEPLRRHAGPARRVHQPRNALTAVRVGCCNADIESVQTERQAYGAAGGPCRWTGWDLASWGWAWR